MLTDRELDAVQSFTGIWSLSHYQMFYSFVLDRPVTRDEASDAITRLTERHYVAHPAERPRPENTYAAITRNPHNFWRSQHLT